MRYSNGILNQTEFYFECEIGLINILNLTMKSNREEIEKVYFGHHSTKSILR